MALITDGLLKDLITILVTIFLGAILYIKWYFGYWNRKKIVTPPISLPYGNAKELSQKIQFGEEFKNIYLEFKPKGLRYCGYYMFTQRVLVVFDLDLAKSIITKDFFHFMDHGEYCDEENDPLTGHLFALRGQKWRNLRAKLTPTFTSGKMKMMFHILVDCSRELVKFMDELCERKEIMDVKEIVGRFATDVIGTCAFGIECNSLRNPNSEFRKYGKKVIEGDFQGIFKHLIAVTVPQVLNILKIPVMSPDVTKFFMGIVKATVDYREKNNIIRNDFMHLLIQLKNNVQLKDEENPGQLKSEENGNEVENALTLNEITAQAFVFFLAGFETSSTTLTFCFYELVANPEIQDRLRKEIEEVLEKHNGKLTYNAIIDMTYMDMCISETLRKYPPFPVLTRLCTQSYKIPNSDVTIDKNVQAFIPILGIQYDPEYYPEPDKFDPERFNSENKTKRHAYTWLPFGEGPRSCIGMRFGLMQVKVTLAVLIKHYKFTLNSKTQVPLQMEPANFIMAPLGGVWLNTEKVSN